MLELSTGDLVLVQDHSLRNGALLSSFVARVEVKHNPPRVVLTVVSVDGKFGVSSSLFPDTDNILVNHNSAQVNIVRFVGSGEIASEETIVKI